jgi:hypothetical protein
LTDPPRWPDSIEIDPAGRKRLRQGCQTVGPATHLVLGFPLLAKPYAACLDLHQATNAYGDIVSPLDTPSSRRRRPTRISVIVVAVAAMLGLAGFVYLSLSSHEVIVAAHDLPAYHQIEESDVRRARITGQHGDAVVVRESVLGRYTLTPVKQDEQFQSDALGPILSTGSLAGLGIVAIEPSVEVALAGNLARGDRVNLLLSATDPSQRQASIALRGVLVVDVRPAGERGSTVVLGLTENDQTALLLALGTSRVVVVRSTAYARP